MTAENTGAPTAEQIAAMVEKWRFHPHTASTFDPQPPIPTDAFRDMEALAREVQRLQLDAKIKSTSLNECINEWTDRITGLEAERDRLQRELERETNNLSLLADDANKIRYRLTNLENDWIIKRNENARLQRVVDGLGRWLEMAFIALPPELDPDVSVKDVLAELRRLLAEEAPT